MEIWIIAKADEQDLSWIMSNNVLHSTGAYYYGDPCISIFPSKEQLTFLILKFGERLIKVAITSREQIEILNPVNLFLPE